MSAAFLGKAMEWLIALLLLAWLLWPKKRAGQTSVTETPGPVEGRARAGSKRWEENFWASAQVSRLAASLRISYEDARGVETERDVQVRFVAPHDQTLMLSAHCNLRDEVRCFRADRVLEAVDLTTGEVIDDLEAWLRAKAGIDGGQAEQDEEMPVIWRVARVLRCVGAADGQFRAVERKIASENLCAVAGVSDIPVEDADLLLRQGGRPTRNALIESLQELKAHPGVLARLLPVAEQMVATQKTVHAEEEFALQEIRARVT